MSKNIHFYSLGYLSGEAKKVLENYKSLEKTAHDIKNKMMKGNEFFSRKSYDLYFTQSEAKFREVELGHIKCNEIDAIINEIRSSLDNMKESFEEMNQYVNKNTEISSLKNISGNIVKRDYDITDNDYIQEILNNNETIAQNEKVNGKGGKGGKGGIITITKKKRLFKRKKTKETKRQRKLKGVNFTLKRSKMK